MRNVPLAQLEAKIIKPGFEKQLEPLLHYRGNLNLGRVHRLWNLLLTMMEQECETVGEGLTHLQHNPDYSQLCGPDRLAQHTGFYGFLSRVQDKPAVANEVPGVLDYARYLVPRPFHLTSVAVQTNRRRSMGAGGWRSFVSARQPKKPGAPIIPGNIKDKDAGSLVYPFLIHDGGRPEHDLLRAILKAVPKNLPPDMKADICQDLAVGILCGDFDQNDLSLPIKEVMARVRKFSPSKWGDVSLDAIIPGTDSLRLIDTLSDEHEAIW